MSRNERSMLQLRLVAIDPPFKAEHQVLFGLQDKRGSVDPVPATKTTVFTTNIEIINGAETGPDFRGDYVHGKKRDRFFYLSWGTPDDAEPFIMFARAKVKLADLPIELLEGGTDGQTCVECRLQATNSKGHPASGTIKPPDVSWHSD